MAATRESTSSPSWMRYIGPHCYWFAAMMANEFTTRQFDAAQPAISGNAWLTFSDFDEVDE